MRWQNTERFKERQAKIKVTFKGKHSKWTYAIGLD